jgi:selenoprotein W-related protein
MTFAEQIGELALVPVDGGRFEVWLDEELVFSKKQQERFPESNELKQLIRDRINPDMSLGHSEVKTD